MRLGLKCCPSLVNRTSSTGIHACTPNSLIRRQIGTFAVPIHIHPLPFPIHTQFSPPHPRVPPPPCCVTYSLVPSLRAGVREGGARGRRRGVRVEARLLQGVRAQAQVHVRGRLHVVRPLQRRGPRPRQVHQRHRRYVTCVQVPGAFIADSCFGENWELLCCSSSECFDCSVYERICKFKFSRVIFKEI